MTTLVREYGHRVRRADTKLTGPLSRWCPKCEAVAGQPCQNWLARAGYHKQLIGFHKERRQGRRSMMNEIHNKVRTMYDESCDTVKERLAASGLASDRGRKALSMVDPLYASAVARKVALGEVLALFPKE